MSEQLQVDANKKIARDYLQRVFNEHQPDLAMDFLTPDDVRPEATSVTSPARRT